MQKTEPIYELQMSFPSEFRVLLRLCFPPPLYFLWNGAKKMRQFIERGVSISNVWMLQ